LLYVLPKSDYEIRKQLKGMVMLTIMLIIAAITAVLGLVNLAGDK